MAGKALVGETIDDVRGLDAFNRRAEHHEVGLMRVEQRRQFTNVAALADHEPQFFERIRQKCPQMRLSVQNVGSRRHLPPPETEERSALFRLDCRQFHFKFPPTTLVVLTRWDGGKLRKSRRNPHQVPGRVKATTVIQIGPMLIGASRRRRSVGCESRGAALTQA
jgi:hypothetical protein